MKRIILFFAVCLGLSVFQMTSDVYAATARTATKRTTTVSTTRRTDNQSTKNSRTNVKPNQQRVVGRTTTARTSTNQQKQNITKRATVASRNTNTNKIVNAVTTRTPVNQNNRQRAARVKDLDIEKMNSIKSADYSQCKTVYYECMDEFCAHKNADLKRCACSSRVHEFDNIKKQLDKAEDKMLDFNQQLLTVGLDKEDAAAINVASEGEIGFATKDTSKSEKTLNKISKTLNSGGDSKINDDMTKLSWSLDIDSAWDDVDALYGVATTAKNGLELYNAARPICVEMAREVCSEDELKIAQDGYKLFIQQDCTTVAKSYSKLHDKAIEKIHESSALLDMARLDAYDQRNSDDTLTCKKKILDQLSDTSVCGENLHKCLDMTGEYIDPSTGKAFLSENLYNLANLIQEPTGEQRWSKIQQNEKFVSFLKSKKRFLTTATEQCRDIANTIWDEFLDDAISQIKLAQKAKMEEIKRGCTQLVADCNTKASEDLEDFDSRALTVFNVMANKTMKEMCSRAQKSCSSLMDVDAANTWSYGMSNISRDITYDSVIDTCTQIGRDCIIQKCNGTAGNFALCKNITSDNRMAILKRDACWTEVLNCVRSADKENLAKFNKGILASFDPENPDASRQAYYESLYTGITYAIPTESNPDAIPTPPVFCDANDKACLIAEQIWGNCEINNDNSTITSLQIDGAVASNKILMPKTGSTLLSWFATNTGTETNNASCNTYGCPIGYQMVNGSCQSLISERANDNCEIANNKDNIIHVLADLTNYCSSGVHDVFGHCCVNGYKSNGICVPGPVDEDSPYYNALRLMTTTCNVDDDYYCPQNDWRQIHIYCITTENFITPDSNGGYDCPNNGFWMLVDQYGNYFKLNQNCLGNANCNGQTNAPSMTYTTACNCDAGTLDCGTSTQACTYYYDSANNEWSFGSCSEISDIIPKNHEFKIAY